MNLHLSENKLSSMKTLMISYYLASNKLSTMKSLSIADTVIIYFQHAKKWFVFLYLLSSIYQVMNIKYTRQIINRSKREYEN